MYFGIQAQLKWVVLAQCLWWGCCQVAGWCYSRVKARPGKETQLLSSLMWWLADLSSSLALSRSTTRSWEPVFKAAQTRDAAFLQDEWWEREMRLRLKEEVTVFYNLFSDMTSYYSCHILWFTQTNLRATRERTIPVCACQQVGILGVPLRGWLQWLWWARFCSRGAWIA